MNAIIRKNQNILINSGKAVIVFGIWAIVRLFLMQILNRDELNLYLQWVTDLTDTGYLTAALISLFVLLFLDFGLRLYIGIRAIRNGRSQCTDVLYIVLSVVYVAVTFFSDLTLFGKPEVPELVICVIGSLAIDLSTFVALIAIILSSMQLKKAEAELAGKEDAHAA